MTFLPTTEITTLLRTAEIRTLFEYGCRRSAIGTSLSPLWIQLSPGG